MSKRLGLASGLAAVMLMAGPELAPAQSRHTDTVVGSCVYAAGAAHCVRQYRYGDRGNSGIQSFKEPSEEEIAESRERDRRWVARCRPYLRQDQYGVSRYHYAARGCEYGKYEE